MIETERTTYALESSEPTVRLHDIGPLAVEIAGVDSPIPGAKPTRILATLLVNANRRVAIDSLLDVVWGDRVTGSTIATLETHIWRLRRLMEPHRGRGTEPTYLVNENSGYRLIVNPDNADSLRFPQLAEQGDRLLASGDPERALQRYELALTLWRGRPFEPVADEEWAAPSIVRLEERFGQLNERRVEALLRTGAPERAITELEELIARLPYREGLWSQLMLARYQAGRVEEALDTYHRARTVLLDTMGVDPGSELTALQQRILAQDPTLAPKRPSSAIELPLSTHEIHLPSRLSELIGRETELDRLTQLMRRSRLVTLVGTAGCGKTRLAIEVARSAGGMAPDGVWFIDLSAVEDPAAVVDVVMSTIGLERPPAGTSLTALRSYVRDRQVLLLVDNCEHVLPGVYQLLDAVLGDDSQCRVLATSREPVGLDGEVLWTLAPLALKGDAAGAEDEPSAAAQLFLARVRSADPMFEPSAEKLADVEAICEAVDGIPLAIELAAGRMRSATMAEVQQQVTTELGGLRRVGYTRTEHHRTVELSIDWSVRLLPATERAVHARLSALPGVFTVEAAQAVAGAPPIAPEDVPSLLYQLVHRSLLAVAAGDRAGQPTRFRQLATVRAHATHALAEAGQTGETLARRRSFVRQLIAARPPLQGEDATGWYAGAEHNHDTLAAVLRDTLHDRPEPFGVQLVGELGTYWLYCQRMAEGVHWAQTALEQTDAPAGYRAVVEVTLAYLLALRDRTDLVLPLVRSALSHSDDPHLDRHTFASGLVAAAWCTWMRGDQVLDFVDGEVRPLAADDPVIGVWADILEAKTALVTEGPVAAGIRVDEVLDRALRVGNIQAAWMASWLDVVCAVFLGDAARGLTRLREVADYQRRLGGTLTVDVVEFEGCFAALTGDDEQAAQLFGRASALAFRAGTSWPISPTTEPLLAQVRRELSTARFEAAWQAGEAKTD